LLSEEYETFKRRPTRIEKKIEKVVEKVEVMPHDYEEIKIHLQNLTC